jgi:uncharacterized short protein YbdD (DUF466 family)
MTAGELARAVQWYVHSLMGDNAYARYCAHHRAYHPEVPLPSEREFWKQRHAEAERNPRSRCC